MQEVPLTCLLVQLLYICCSRGRLPPVGEGRHPPGGAVCRYPLYTADRVPFEIHSFLSRIIPGRQQRVYNTAAKRFKAKTSVQSFSSLGLCLYLVTFSMMMSNIEVIPDMDVGFVEPLHFALSAILPRVIPRSAQCTLSKKRKEWRSSSSSSPEFMRVRESWINEPLYCCRVYTGIIPLRPIILNHTAFIGSVLLVILITFEQLCW